MYIKIILMMMLTMPYFIYSDENLKENIKKVENIMIRNFMILEENLFKLKEKINYLENKIDSFEKIEHSFINNFQILENRIREIIIKYLVFDQKISQLEYELNNKKIIL